MNLLRKIIIYYFSSVLILNPLYADIGTNTLPTGGEVVLGNIQITQPELGRMNVDQSTEQGIINWQTFNVGSSASVHFNQPGVKSSILNNVLSGTSIINGSIFSNGRLILVNPTGILTGPTSAIRAEGAILSTLKITNDNFINNNFNFSTNTSSSLTTQGNINAEYVALISPKISNKGNITSNVTTALAAGDDVRISISDSNLLTVSVNPSKLQTTINNEGNIKTQNGIVTLKTDVAQSVVDEVVKVDDAKAKGLVTENGVVKLIANSGSIEAKNIKIDAGVKGAATISGTLNSNSETSNGGAIEVTAKDIDVNAATISADGQTGGGTILVGGDWQGTGDLLQATYVNIDKNTKISASALNTGAGGKIVAWSDIKNLESVTTVNGYLVAIGIDGDGGKIETSGSTIITDQIIVKASSQTGKNGLWLIDPYDYTIDATAVTNITSALNAGTDVSITTSSNSASYGSGGSSSGSGDITFTSNFATTAASATSSTLTLEAARHIVSNSGVTIGDGGSHSLSLDFTAGGNITLNGAVDVAGSIGLTTTTYTSYVAGDQTTQSFSYTGAEQTWSVPTGVTSITIDGYGAAGGHGASDYNARGGKGGRLVATSTVTAGETLYLYLGGKGGDTTVNPGTGYRSDINPYSAGNALGGFNGGGAPGSGAAGAGGGATDVRRGGNSLSDRIYVAGGGGGGANQRRGSQPGGDGGQGGGLTGGAGSRGGGGGTIQTSLSSGMGPNGNGGYGGNGGTQSAGGAAVSVNGLVGTLGVGGSGGGGGRTGGGGGGGYYGGSGGGSGSANDDAGGGGGGGSSYSSGTIVTNTQGYSSATGNGSLTFTYTPLTASTATGAITINQGITSGGNTNISTQGALTVKESSNAKFGTITAASISANNTNTDITIANAPTVSGASTFDNTGALWLKNGGTFTGGLTVSNDGNFYTNGTIQSTDSAITLKYFRNCVSGIDCGGLTVNSGGGAITMAGGYTWHNRSLTVRSQGGSTNTITDTGSYNSGQFGQIKMYADGDISLSGKLDVGNSGSDIYIETDGILNMNNTAILESDYYSETIEVRANGLINPGKIEVGRRYHSAPGTFTLRPISNTSSIEFSPTNDPSITTDVWYDSDLLIQTQNASSAPYTGAALVLGHASQSGDIQMAAYDQKVRLTANTSGTVTLNGNLGGSNLISVNIPRGSVAMTGVTVATIAADSFAPSQTYSTVTVSGNSAITTSGGSPTVSMGGLIGSANLSSNTNMTIGSANTNGIFSGVLSGAMKLTVTGTGVFEPTATNTYTGGTVIDGGIIAAFTDRNWGALPGSVDPDNIILKNGGKAIFGSKNSSNSAGHTYWAANRGINLPTSGQQFIEMGSGGSGSAHIQGVVNGIGGITFTRSGSKAIRFYGENTYTGDTKFNFTSGSNNNIEITPKAFQNSTVYLSPTNTNVGRGFSRTSGDGNIILGGLAGDMTDWRLVGGRNVEFGSNNANTSVAGGISRYAAAGNLIKKGTGTTTFTATSGQELDSSSIGLQIDAGKLVLNGDWGRNNTAAGTVAIAAGATLEIDTAENNTYSGVLSGAGTLLLGGSGTQTFSGDNTFSGTINIADGGIKASHANSLGATPIVISSSGRFETGLITLPSLRINGNVTLQSGITTTGSQYYNGNVIVKAGSVASPVEYTTTNSDITFAGTLKGEGNAKARSIAINAGTSDVLFGDRVGYAFNNQTVDITNTADSFYKMTVTGDTITVKGDVMTYEEQTYNGSVLIGSTATNGTTRTLLSMDPKVVFNGTVDDTSAGKHTLIAKAVEIDRGVNSTPIVDFKSTVGRSVVLANYSGLTGYQTIGANWGVIDSSVSFGTTSGTGQTMGASSSSSSSSSSSNDNAKKASRSVSQEAKNFKTAENIKSSPFNIFRNGNTNTLSFIKNLEIVYAESPQFGATAKPSNNNFRGNTNIKPNFDNNNIPADTTNSDNKLLEFNQRNNNKDIRELFKTLDGENGKGRFFNPYALDENIEPNPNTQPGTQNLEEEDDA